MMDPRRLEQLDLGEQSTLQEISAAVEEIVFYDLHVEAFEFLKSLDQRLRFLSANELGPLVYKYEEALVQLRIVGFGDLNEKDAVDLIRQHAVDFFATGLTLDDKLKQRLVLLPEDERDEFKKKVRDAIIKNDQTLSKLPLHIGDAPPVSPTVGNWIRDYTFNLGSDIALPEKLSEYYTHSKNMLALEKDDREKVVSLLRVYERLKFPSDVVEGYDAPLTLNLDDSLYVAIDGQVITLKSMSKALTPRKIPTGILAAVELRRQRVPRNLEALIRGINDDHAADDEKRFAEEEELLGRVDANMEKVLDIIESALVINDHEKILNTVSILARSGAIGQVFSRPALRQIFTTEFLEPLGQNQSVQASLLAAYMMTHQDNSQYAGAFVEWALLRSFHGDEAEAARLGNRLENALAALGQTEFVGMTYFDVSQGSFRWTPLKANPDGSLAWVE